MYKRPLFHLNEGDCIYVYSGGKLEGRGRLEGQGRYVCVVEDKNESFLCWRKHNGNEVYTNLNGISVETMNENTAYLENTRETCERGYVQNQNISHMYNQRDNDTYPQEYNDYKQNPSDTYDHSYNNYEQNMDNTYQPSYDNYNQNSSNMYDSTYNPNPNDREYNTYDQDMENTYDQEYENHTPDNNNYNQNTNDMYNQEYNTYDNQNNGCTCKQCYNQNYPK
ncbi:hypothetical protein ACQKFK_31905 [Bacillus mycoides]|uniref:hypothetical protein n=1 Tax=Bacillus mycoides TaxID=1405 RepID=UPI003D02C597